MRGKSTLPITKPCACCGGVFIASNNSQKYCGVECKRKVARTSGSETTARQYELISGNWFKYFQRLCCRSFNRNGLTADQLITLLDKQRGKCALSGVELTCVLQKGVVTKTNASIDRIDPKGAYTTDNIQLVCAVLNKFRIDTPLDEFVSWCRKVAKHALR